MLREHPDELEQLFVGDDALPGGGGVEVHHVNHPGELGVFAGDRPHRVGEALAQAGAAPPQRLPARLRREVEAQDAVVALGQVGRAQLGGEPTQLVVEPVGQPLEEDQRQDVLLMYSLYLGASTGPCRAQAAFQSQVSRVFSSISSANSILPSAPIISNLPFLVSGMRHTTFASVGDTTPSLCSLFAYIMCGRLQYVMLQYRGDRHRDPYP